MSTPARADPDKRTVTLEGDLRCVGPSGTIELRNSDAGPVFDASSFAAFLSLRELLPARLPPDIRLAPTLLARRGVAFARIEGPLGVRLQWPKRVLPKIT
ncbi:MAG: hypothetical protein AAF108_09105 [Planctomycetota bacterium]